MRTTMANARRSPIIRLHDCPLQPWKNGLGSTREIAVQPSGAGIDDFVWRVSVAEVASNAPFSPFPGVDRQIVLLDGAGLRMMLDGAQVHDLITPFEPFAFAGEARVAVALAGGPTRDFNLMVNRARARGELQVWRGPGRWIAGAGIVLVHAARGAIDAPAGRLQTGDSWRPGHAATSAVVLPEGAVALAVRLVPPG